MTETLAALAILALAIGGLATGARTLGLGQGRLSGSLGEAYALQSAQAALQHALEGDGPFRGHAPEELTGDASGFRYACGEPTPCEARLEETPRLELRLARATGERRFPLHVRAPARFVYHRRQSDSEVWPPASETREPLKAITVAAGTAESPGRTLLTSRVWREQPMACAFDVLLQDCR